MFRRLRSFPNPGTHTAKALPGFYGMHAIEIIILPLNGMPVHSRFNFPTLARTHLQLSRLEQNETKDIEISYSQMYNNANTIALNRMKHPLLKNTLNYSA